MMNINRNTINGDIDYWYEKIIKNTNYVDPEGSIIINIQRLDVQRSRLRESLDRVENFQQRQSIERMILDIDCKIISIKMKLADTVKRIHDLKISELNKWLKENGKDIRFMTLFDKIVVSRKAHQRISKIINEDRKRLGI